MSDKKIWISKDLLDSEMIHMHYEWVPKSSTTGKPHILYACTFHSDSITDVFGDEIAQEVRDLDSGERMEIRIKCESV